MRRKRRQPPAPVSTGYDYSTREAREETVSRLFSRAKNARGAVEQEWQRCTDYYNFIHDVTDEFREFTRDTELPFVPAVVPDPWILVESQIDPHVPEPEFRGRDDDGDSLLARQREFAVRYIAENNRLQDMNTRNERRLLKLGDAFWKAYWDPEMTCGLSEGDIRVRDVPTESIFPDPSIRDGQLQDGQYVDYVYSLHKVRFCKLFKAELAELGLSQEDILSEDYVSRAGLFDMTSAVCDTDDTVQVLEHWFRQPEDTLDEEGREIPAGSVACSIQAGGRELRYIPNYWVRTGRQNRLFPFVHYWRIGDENRFWNRSELFPVLDLVDGADRRLGMAQLNDAFLSNDILLLEEGALADGSELTNEPGAVVKVRSGRIGGVSRLGGLHPLTSSAAELNWYKEEIERTNRNYESSLGKETERQTTAAALSMLRSDAADQSDIKKADRLAGFERLYELLDWLALEFFDDDRLLFLGAKDGEPGRSLLFNADRFARTLPAVTDAEGAVVRPEREYFPRVDVTVSAGETALRGRQAALTALQDLAKSAITAENWRLLAAQLEVLDVPGKAEIIAGWRERFEGQGAAS